MAEVGTVYVTVMPSSKGFSKALQGDASSAGSAAGKGFSLSFGKIVSGSALGNIISSAVGKVSGAISSSMGSAIARVDTLNNFPKVMQNLGYGADEATASINTLAAGIDGMPTSLDGIVGMTQQLAPLCGGLDKATELSLAMNNMFLASGASTADQARAMQQYTQMLARGKVELNDWRALQEVMPGQLNQVAVALLGAGKNSTDLYDALKKGKVSMNDFNEAVKTLNKEGVGEFASFEQQARSATEGIGTAMENVQNRIAKAVGSVIDHIGQGSISGVINGFSSQFGNMATVVCQAWDGMTKTLRVEHIKTAFEGLGAAFGNVFGNADMADSFGRSVGNVLNGIIPTVKTLAPLVQGLGQAFLHGVGFIYDAWTSLMMSIDFAGFKAEISNLIDTVSALFPPCGDAASAVGQQLGGAINMLIPVIHYLTPFVQMLALGFKFCADNAGWLLPVVITLVAAFKAFQVIQSASGLITRFTGTVSKATPTMAASAKQMLSLAVAAIGLGAGILLACAGVSLLAFSAIQLANAGPMAALALVGLVAVVFAFGAAMYFAGPALTAGALGMVAFGAAVLMVGAGIFMVCAGLTLLSGALPMISAYGLSAAASITALGMSLITVVPGAIALAAGIGLLGVAAIVAGGGMLLLAAGSLGAFAGLMLCSIPMAIIAPALQVAGPAAFIMAAALLLIAVASIAATPGLVAFGACIGGVALAIGAAVLAFGGLAAALGGCAGALSVSAASMVIVVASCNAITGASKAATAGLSSIGSGAAKATSQFSSAASKISSDASNLAFRIQAAASRIQASFNGMRLHVPSPTLGQMPHFSMTGKFNYETGEVPRINVNWYATGGVFNRPSLIGVGDAGRELVTPEKVMQDYLDKAASSGMDSQMMARMVTLLEMILNAIPSLTDRDLQRMIRRTANA